MKEMSKYEKNLHSEDPFVRSMYEDLETRIQDYEGSHHDKTEHATWKDASGVIASMGLIIVFLVATLV